MSDPVKIERRGPVLEVTLDRPKANAIDSATSRRMSETFVDFAADDGLRVAVLTGAGDRFFSAGWDLKAAAAGTETGDYGTGGFGGLTELLDLDKPVIAAVNGYAAGGGFEIALACDLMVAAEHATFFLGEVRVGITPEPIGVRRLLARLPRAVALEMLYTARRMDAAEARALGLANRVVPGPELMAAARALADEIVAGAPLAVMALKEMARKSEALTLADTLALHRAKEFAWYERVKTSADAEEGPRAFAEKRAPQWQGR